MKRIITLLLALFMLATVIASCDENHVDSSGTTTLLTRNVSVDKSSAKLNQDKYEPIEDFTNEILKKLADENRGERNTVFSPLSAYLALAMVKEGARGETLAEMNECMGEISPTAIKKLISHLMTLDKTKVKIGDSVWIDNSISDLPKSEYLDSLSKYYLAECYKTSLADAEADVNAWIEEKTDGMLKNLLDDTVLDDSVMALVNTVYMDAKWRYPFSEELIEDYFISSDGKTDKVDFMQSFGRYELVFESDSLIGAVIPYSDDSLVFAAMLPKDESLNASDAAVLVSSGGGWSSLVSAADKKKANILLPQFELESGFSLNEILKSMGIISAFGDGADFGGIVDGIKIDGVMQTAKMRLDEKGTEAAAATVVTMAPTSISPNSQPISLVFNRPFAFAVIDQESGAVLFSGEYNKAK